MCSVCRVPHEVSTERDRSYLVDEEFHEALDTCSDCASSMLASAAKLRFALAVTHALADLPEPGTHRGRVREAPCCDVMGRASTAHPTRQRQEAERPAQDDAAHAVQLVGRAEPEQAAEGVQRDVVVRIRVVQEGHGVLEVRQDEDRHGMGADGTSVAYDVVAPSSPVRGASSACTVVASCVRLWSPLNYAA